MPPKWLFFSVLVCLSVMALLQAWPSVRVLALAQYGSAQVIASGQGFPIQIAVGSDGTVYWENQHPFGSGSLMKLAPGAITPTQILGGLSYAEGMGIDAAGNLYYDEYMEGILYKLPVGSSTPQVLATGLNYPNFMSVDAKGDVYLITGRTCGNTIIEYNATTAVVSTILAVPVLDGLFIDPSGDLYFTTCSNNQIEVLPRGSSTPRLVYTWTGSSYPASTEGIAVDSLGNIFFTVYGESVQVLPAGTTTPIVLSSVSSYTDGYAQQMALDSCDNVYFVDSYQGNVWKVPTTTSCVPLRSGWNLVSLPLVPNNPSISVVLSSQIASHEVVSVWTYSASSKSWLVFTPGKPSTLTTMTDGNGYWIYMTHSDTLYVNGYVIAPGSAPPSYSLVAGWNLVGFKPQPDPTASETVGAYLTSITGDYNTNIVWVYASGVWIQGTSTTTLTPGEAMWIFVTSPSGATLTP